MCLIRCTGIRIPQSVDGADKALSPISDHAAAIEFEAGSRFLINRMDGVRSPNLGKARCRKGAIMDVTNLQFLAFVKAILEILATSKDLDEARERVTALFKL